ncbi:uncharacterized protein C2845_PM17G11790 [Panicum miliaceum]|uniref:Xylanase inhibitor C-terminal domain-containing protein n=1 Tax=Panicum miliaceum TaxID=4540 RepID=A0A3L6Q4I6_PANMI|nr:uncharacterized protein C2845_PM17G11790 [Panicum miliaceum]
MHESILLKNPRNSAYYSHVCGVAVNKARVPMPADLDARRGTSSIMFSTVTPYTTQAPGHIYRPPHDAFDVATTTSGIVPRAPPGPCGPSGCATSEHSIVFWLNYKAIFMDL